MLAPILIAWAVNTLSNTIWSLNGKIVVIAGTGSSSFDIISSILQVIPLTMYKLSFGKKVLSVNKQITQRNNRVKFEFSDTKTSNSRRIVPITKVSLNDFKMHYEQDKKDYYGFNDDFFVVSDAKPITDLIYILEELN